MTAKTLPFPTRAPAEEVIAETPPATKDGDGEEIVVHVILQWEEDDEPTPSEPVPEPTGRRSGFWWFLLGVLIGAS
jgi:hypothetical protein